MKTSTFKLFLIGGFCVMTQTAHTTWAGDVAVAERFMRQVEEDLSPDGKGASQAELDLNNVEDQLKDVELAARERFAMRIAAAKVKIEAGLAAEQRERLMRTVRLEMDNAKGSIDTLETVQNSLKRVQELLDTDDGRKLVTGVERDALLAEVSGLRKQAAAKAVKQTYGQIDSMLRDVEKDAPAVIVRLKDRPNRIAGRNDSGWLLVQLNRADGLLKDCPQDEPQVKALAARHGKVTAELQGALQAAEQEEQAATAAAKAPAPGELNDEQKHALHMFTNNLPDALEKLDLLKKGRLKMDWQWYQQWEIGPVRESLELCRKAQVPPDTKLELRGNAVRYAEAEKLAAGYEADMKAAFGIKADDKITFFRNSQPADCLKRYEPFRDQMVRGLANDKLRLMDEEVLIQGVVYAQDPPQFFIGYYGEGRKLLTRPEDFAKSRIWATTAVVYASNDTLKLDPHWRITAYHFDNDGKLCRTVNERGAGTRVPDEYFRVGDQ